MGHGVEFKFRGLFPSSIFFIFSLSMIPLDAKHVKGAEHLQIYNSSSAIMTGNLTSNVAHNFRKPLTKYWVLNKGKVDIVENIRFCEFPSAAPSNL